MNDFGSFDRYLEPWLIARVPDMAAYSHRGGFASQLYRHRAMRLQRWRPTTATAKLLNRIVMNPWYEGQHQELYRRGIIGLPYAEKAPHLLTFAMGYTLAQADISLHCPVKLTGAIAYVLGTHAPDCAVRPAFSLRCRTHGWTGQDRRHMGDRTTWRQRCGSMIIGDRRRVRGDISKRLSRHRLAWRMTLRAELCWN